MDQSTVVPAGLPPAVLALVGSPRRKGNTVSAVEVAARELGDRGVACETVLLCDFALTFPADAGSQEMAAQESRVESLLERVWAADGLILATPVYFSNVSAHMKAFMDRTNDRFMRSEWLTPKTIGLVVVGAQGGFTATVDALRRYLDLVAPSHPPIQVASGHADEIGEAQRSQEVGAAMRSMAARMADILQGSSVPVPEV